MRTVIVGVGNALMQDDGVGVRVVQALMELGLPEGAEAIDAGTSTEPAYDLVSADRVLVVDAARLGGPAGTIYRLTVEEATEVGGGVRSCHDMGLVQTLRAITSEPCVAVLGIEPKEIGWGLNLSAEVEASIPRVVRFIRQELHQELQREPKESQCS